MHDSQGVEPLVRGIPPIRSRRGPRRGRHRWVVERTVPWLAGSIGGTNAKPNTSSPSSA
jgi:hypothetical protein